MVQALGESRRPLRGGSRGPFDAAGRPARSPLRSDDRWPFGGHVGRHCPDQPQPTGRRASHFRFAEGIDRIRDHRSGPRSASSNTAEGTTPLSPQNGTLPIADLYGLAPVVGGTLGRQVVVGQSSRASADPTNGVQHLLHLRTDDFRRQPMPRNGDLHQISPVPMTTEALLNLLSRASGAKRVHYLTGDLCPHPLLVPPTEG